MAKSIGVDKKVIEAVRLADGKAVKLDRFKTASKAGVKDRDAAAAAQARMLERVNELQEMLYAQGKYAVLVVLQAMDTGGKDGTIRHVFGPLNPQGVRVSCFKKPSAEELAHDYLWRIHQEVPAKGMIRVFNRSHYEDVLVARVAKLAPAEAIEQRYGQINAFEQYLTENGVVILKLFLNISHNEQRKRLKSRLANPDKHWKFDPADIEAREQWDAYVDAYERMLRACSTAYAPWYVIPADRKWYRNWLVAGLLLQTLEGLDLAYPEPAPGLDAVRITK